MSTTIAEEVIAYEELLSQLDLEEREILATSIKKIRESLLESTEKQNNLIRALTGDTDYSPSEKIKLEIDSLLNYFQRRRDLLANSLTASQVVQLLGTQEQTPHDRVKSKTLFAVRDHGGLKFPLWQFDPEGDEGVIDGLPEVLKNLSLSSAFAKLNWFMRSNPVFDGLTPVAALQQGLKMRVIAEAKGVGGAFW
ncbi:hypothetical protein [Gloeocapsa sp. PCC 73106]|uniref:hypothetical protein n=1 Tax=Gloeocapsa sp. PCC 73106 TaxID=102232 RepID=UPI0002AC2AE3|nr:hypothetical protein [Gloeocapsa sp. PCC 73106]ELR96941.1 hypothetical protein GLO73106DRAFT_00007420 [Gloeocapsa sp. PCC 73106]